MRKIATVSLLSGVFFLLTSGASLTQDKYMVMSIKGKAESSTSKSKSWKKLTVGQILGNNDIIKTSYASYVKLMVNEERLVSIDENLTRPMTEYSAKKNQKVSSETATGKILQLAAQQMKRTKERKSGASFGAVRGGSEGFNAVFPKYGIMNTAPVFEWIDGDGPSEYDFILRDDTFKLVEKQTLKTTSLDFSRTSKTLENGKTYYWQVVRTSDGETTDVVQFTVLARDTVDLVALELSKMGKELAAMNADEVTTHLIRGIYFEKRGLYTDAFREYKATIALAPDCEEYREMMRNLLMNLKLYGEEEYLLK
jgi:hypothetical protein